jgi:hypothetical protein
VTLAHTISLCWQNWPLAGARYFLYTVECVSATSAKECPYR